jgi:hypothetical protein
MIRAPGKGGVSVFLDFETDRQGDWLAHTRLGGVAEIIGDREYLAGRIRGKFPSNGAVVTILSTAKSGSTPEIVTGRFISPVLGDFDFIGRLDGATLRAELFRENSQRPVGDFFLMAMPTRSVLGNYKEVAAKTRQALDDHYYDPHAVKRDAWTTFYRELDMRMARVIDDPDALLAFESARSGVKDVHLDLIRDPNIPTREWAGTNTGRRPSPVDLTIDRSGVAHLTIPNFELTDVAIDRAFAYIDSARATTLIVDIRGNRGRDYSSLSLLGHLVKDSTLGGVILTRRWYFTRSTPPSSAELAAFPILRSDDDTVFHRAVHELPGFKVLVAPRSPRFDGTVQLLIDHGTAGTSEPLAHLLKTSGRATLVGERTAGSTVIAFPHSVPAGWVLFIPEGDYYTPQGFRLEGRGVAPDSSVRSRR